MWSFYIHRWDNNALSPRTYSFRWFQTQEEATQKAKEVAALMGGYKWEIVEHGKE